MDFVVTILMLIAKDLFNLRTIRLICTEYLLDIIRPICLGEKHDVHLFGKRKIIELFTYSSSLLVSKIIHYLSCFCVTSLSYDFTWY